MAANSWKTYLTPKVKRLLVIGLILLVSFTIKNWLNTSKATTPTSKGTPSSVSINVPQVQSLLDKLTVADSQKVTYKRSDFVTAWKDVDNNNCDTRNDQASPRLVEHLLDAGVAGRVRGIVGAQQRGCFLRLGGCKLHGFRGRCFHCCHD